MGWRGMFCGVTALSLLGVTTSHVSAATLLADWDFSEGSGTTIASEGGTINPTLILPSMEARQPTWSPTAGPGGTTGLSFELDRSTFVQASNVDGALLANTNFSFEVFFRLESTPTPTGTGTMSIISNYDSGSNYTYDLRLTDAVLNLTTRGSNGTSEQRLRITGLNVSQWVDKYVYVAGVADTSGGTNRLTLYYGIDGALQSATNTHTLPTFVPTDGTSDFNLGSRIDGNSYFFDGDFGRARVYNGALTLAEVQANYGALVPEPTAVLPLIGGAALLLRRRA